MADSQNQLVDLRGALDELGLEESEFRELVGDLREYVDSTLPKLEQAIQSENRQEIRDLAHSLKGALNNMRFNRAGSIAQELEKGFGESSTASLNSLFSEFVAVLKDSFSQMSV